MNDVFPIYERLWRRAQADTMFVHYGGWPDESLAGYFHPRDDDGRERKPEIAIRRPYYKEPAEEPHRESNAPAKLPQPDLVAELFTLAHEYGHSRSWAGRTEAAEYKLYDAAAKRRDLVTAEAEAKLPGNQSTLERNERLRRAVYDRLDDDSRTRIMLEESLAWEIGREVLAELGYPDLAMYDAIMKKHLHYHRYRLGMEAPWPGDDLGSVTTE